MSLFIWVDFQAVISSIFMTPVMFSVFRAHLRKEGWLGPATLMAGLWALHAVVVALLFIALAALAWRDVTLPSDDIWAAFAVWMVVTSSLALAMIKTSYIWLGEGRARSPLWVSYLCVSSVWAVYCIWYAAID